MQTQQSHDPALAITPGLLRRLAAMLYDGLLLLALMLVATALLTLPFGRPSGLAMVAFQIFQFGLLPLLFFGGFWVGGGQTLGMRAWRIRVVREDGSPLTWEDAVRRYLTAWLSWLSCGLGYLWILLDRDDLAWHDRLSHTRLVLLKR